MTHLNHSSCWKVGFIQHLFTLKGHEGAVNAVKFNVDGSYCLSCSQDKSVILWNPHKALLIKQYKGVHNHGISDVSVTSDNSKFVSVGGDYAAFLWDVAEAKVIRKFIGHIGRLECCRVNLNDSVLCTGSYDKSVRLWDLKSSNRLPIQILSDSKDSITSICVTDSEILTSSVDGYIRCYDIRIGKMFCDSFGSPVTSVSLSTDKTCVLSSCMDEAVYLTEKSTGEVVAKYCGHTHQKYKLNSILTPYDECVVSGSENHKIFMWDLLKGGSVDGKTAQHGNATSPFNEEDFQAINAHGDVVTAVQAHPNQNILLSASSDKTIKVWLNKLSVK